MPKWIVDKHFNSHMSSLQITAMKCTEVDKEGGVLAATVTCRLVTDGATEVVLHVRVDKLANFISASQHHRIARRLEAALLVTLQGGPPPPQMPPPPPQQQLPQPQDPEQQETQIEQQQQQEQPQQQEEQPQSQPQRPQLPPLLQQQQQQQRPAPSLPSDWVDPSQVDATGRLEDADAVQDVIRANYIEGGMSGMMPSPILVQGSLAAKAATQMATARVALPGEGPARTEISPGAREVF